MKQSLTIAYLYPSEMNIYGDRGNVITLQKRCAWRGIDVQIDEVHLDKNYDFNSADIVFGGGGQDKGQELVASDLQSKGASLRSAAEGGLPMLLVCGLYQLFGHHFTTTSGKRLDGLGILDIETVGSDQRLIGNIVVDSPYGRLVGFENHSGLTTLGEGVEPLGAVITGHGNDGASGAEGTISRNIIGTYLHGPILPKNPRLADRLIQTALERKYGKDAGLKPLEDSLEAMTAESAAARPS